MSFFKRILDLFRGLFGSSVPVSESALEITNTLDSDDEPEGGVVSELEADTSSATGNEEESVSPSNDPSAQASVREEPSDPVSEVSVDSMTLEERVEQAAIAKAERDSRVAEKQDRKRARKQRKSKKPR